MKSEVLTACQSVPADIVPDAPNEIAVPLIVIAEFASFAFAIEPANCAFVIPVPKPPTLAGKVTVFA